MIKPMVNNLNVLTDFVRLLSFRRLSPNLAHFYNRYLATALVFTWLAGIGRYWDNPRAEIWQYAGVGSLAYVFVLAFILWVIIAPLKPQHWSYKNVLLFVSMTSPPALLYAIPVERFMSLENAQTANAWFLAVVATWRVALLVWFLRVVGNLQYLSVFAATLLPITLIVVFLTALNLEHVVFNLMSGIRPEQRSPNDLSYNVVMTIALFSFLASPVLVAIYIWVIYRAKKLSNK